MLQGCCTIRYSVKKSLFRQCLRAKNKQIKKLSHKKRRSHLGCSAFFNEQILIFVFVVTAFTATSGLSKGWANVLHFIGFSCSGQIASGLLKVIDLFLVTFTIVFNFR